MAIRKLMEFAEELFYEEYPASYPDRKDKRYNAQWLPKALAAFLPAAATFFCLNLDFRPEYRDTLQQKEARKAGISLNLGPAEADAQALTGYVSRIKWDPSTDSGVAKYTAYYWKENNPAVVYKKDISKDVIEINLTGLEVGRKYHMYVTASDRYGNESDRTNEIVFVAKMLGNVETSSVSVTRNRVDSYDRVECFPKAYMSAMGSPNWVPQCDFNNDGVVDIKDLNLFNANYGKTQPNDMGTVYCEPCGPQ